MSCRRAFDIDLAAFLADSRPEEFAAFREHYPRCAACAAEVRVWTVLRARLASGAGAGEAHPEPRLLLRYQEDPTQLGPGEPLRVSTHLESCASCRDELAALRGFDPGVSTAPLTAAPSRPGLGALLDSLRRLLWHPGFAYALALLVTAPALFLWVTPRDPALREGSAAVAQEERAPVPLAEGTGRTEERPFEVALHQERSLASSLEKKDAPEPGVVAPGAPAAATPARSRQASHAREAPAAEALRERRARPDTRTPVPLQIFAEGEVGEVRTEALRALGYVVSSMPAAESEPRVGDRAQTVALQDLGGGVFALRVPVDPSARVVEIRVVSPDGHRELVQRFAGGASEVELRIPASWLETGTQRVERRLDDTMQVFSLEVP